MIQRLTHYRIWTSDIGWEECEIDGWLADALRHTSIRRPVRVQFKSKKSWLDVAESAVQSAVKTAWSD